MKLLKTVILLVLILGIFGGGGYFAWLVLYKPVQPTQTERAAMQPPAPPTPPPDLGAPLLAKAQAFKKEKKFAEAREQLEAIVTNYPAAPSSEEARNLLGEFNADAALSTQPAPDKTEYVVKSGDSLDKIARQFKTSSELIMRSNNLANTIIQPGQRLAIFQPDFSLEIPLAQKKVVLLHKGKFFKQYPVKAFAIPGGIARTAETKSRVQEKVAWRDGKRVTFGSKEYPGSTRWIVLAQAGYVIYPETTAGAPGAAAAKPPTGLGLDPAELEELHTLVSPGIAVTILP